MHVTTTGGATTSELRRAVLRPDWSPERAIPGDDRPDAVHVAAFTDGTDGVDGLVGACLVFPQPCDWRPEAPAWILRSMAVDPGHRGEGIGRAVLAGALDVARMHAAALLWCHARASAVGFWRAEGWQLREDRGSYTDPETGLDHVDMYRVV